MKKYKLFLVGTSYIDSNGNICCYKLTTSRNSKLAAETYGREAIVTDMHNHIVSWAKLEEGKAHNVYFEKGDKIA